MMNSKMCTSKCSLLLRYFKLSKAKLLTAYLTLVWFLEHLDSLPGIVHLDSLPGIVHLDGLPGIGLVS